MIVYNDDDLEPLSPEEKANWKGYTYKMTYETWDEESLEIGETDDKGWVEEGSRSYESLYDVLMAVASDANWLEWSSSNPDARCWINSEGDTDFRTGDVTYNCLWIERADGIPLSEDEIIFISQVLGLRHPKIKYGYSEDDYKHDREYQD